MEAWFIVPALALAAGAFALVPLGHQVLKRGVVFIDLAVAQAAAAGSLWSMVMLHRADEGPLQLVDYSSVVGALICAAAVAGLNRRWPERREALIGLLYVLFACLALLGAGLDAHGRDRMLELLAADVLWAQTPQVTVLAAAGAGLWGLMLWRPRALAHDLAFYAVFAVLVSLAVPVLGLFVVFALLIGPALWLRGPLMGFQAGPSLHPHEGESQRAVDLLPGVAVGSGAALLGLAASWWWDAPSGPCVALACAIVGLGSVAAAGRR